MSRRFCVEAVGPTALPRARILLLGGVEPPQRAVMPQCNYSICVEEDMSDVYLSPTLSYLTLAGMPGGFEAWVVQLSPSHLSATKRYGSAASHHRQKALYQEVTR